MKKNKKTAVFSVVFPNAGRFLNDYMGSLEKQTHKDFDVIIVNDGVPDLGGIASRHNLNIIEVPAGKTIAENRQLGITYAKKAGYDYLVFSDSDDMFAPDRIEKSIVLLDKYDAVVNDITTIDENGRILRKHYMSGRLKDRGQITLDFIRDKNVCGFTNTAIRLSCIKKTVSLNKALIAVDWYFFSRLLANGCNFVFSKNIISFYRLYAGNTAGFSSACGNADKVRSGVRVKIMHYRAMNPVDGQFRRLYVSFSRLGRKMAGRKYAEKYIEKLRAAKSENLLWWENIKLPEDIEL